MPEEGILTIHRTSHRDAFVNRNADTPSFSGSDVGSRSFFRMHRTGIGCRSHPPHSNTTYRYPVSDLFSAAAVRQRSKVGRRSSDGRAGL